MSGVELLGYALALVGIAIVAMRTMIALRITAIVFSVGQIAFGLLTGIHAFVIQHVILLPINGFRLFEMLRLVKQVKAASGSNHSLDCLKPFMTRRVVRAGETLFRKGDSADRMFLVAEGGFRIEEIGIDVAPGSVFGELGMLSPSRKRTQTCVCIKDGAVLEMGYEKVKELYYQNPTFGFYFLKLSTERLFDNIDRLEHALQAREGENKLLRAALAASPPVVPAETQPIPGSLPLAPEPLVAVGLSR